MIKEYIHRYKVSLFTMGIMFLIMLASFVGNFQFKRIYWLAEMPIFIFLLALSTVGILSSAFKNSSKIRPGATDVLVVLYFFYIFLRTILASYPELPNERLWVPVTTFIFYTILRTHHSIPNGKSYRHIIQFIIILAVFQALIGTFQVFTGLRAYDNSQQAAGFFSNPALLGCFLAIGLCLCFCNILLARIRKQKYVYQVLLVPILLGLILSGSRTAWIATGLSCTLIFLLQYMKGERSLLKVPAPVVLIIISVTATAVLYYLYQMDKASVGGRMLIWNISWKMFLDHPIFGMGYGSFYTEFGNYQAGYFLSETRSQQEILTASMNYFAFSEPLSILVEQGIVGALLFITLTGHCILLAMKNKEYGANGNRFYLFSIMSVLLIFGIFSYPFQDLLFNLLYFLVISLIATFEEPLKRPDTLKCGRYCHAGFAALFLILVAHSIRKIQAIHTWKTAKEKILVSEGDALLGYRQAYPLLANNGSFLFNYGSELADLGQYPQAEELLKRATMYGNSVALHLRLGKVQQSLGYLAKAEQSLVTASAMNPKLFLPLHNLMVFYKETGQDAKCRRLAQLILDKPIKIPSEIIENIKILAQSYLEE